MRASGQGHILRHARYLLLVVASIGAALWLWLGIGDTAPETPDKSAADAPADPLESRQEPAVVQHDASDKVERDLSAQSDAIDVRTQFRTSNDYWEFAERVHDAAKHGDGAAQYYLSVALERCEFLYGFFFIEQRPGARPRIRTLDEAQQLTATTKGSRFTPDDVRDIQSRCQRIMNTRPPPFGDAGEWMETALASGYPLAQVRAAERKALQVR